MQSKQNYIIINSVMGLSSNKDLAVGLESQTITPFGDVRWIVGINSLSSERWIQDAVGVIF